MSSSRAAIKKIEKRIAVLSEENRAKNEQVIREFEDLRESLLLNEEEEEEEEYVDLQLSEKKRVVKIIRDLLSFDSEHHQSWFTTPELLNNLQDVVDPMLHLNEDDLVFIRNSVEKLYACSYDYAILDFCKEANEWLQRPTDSDDDDDDVPNGDDDKITFLRENLNEIISEWDKKVKLNRIKQREARANARALALVQSYNNNPDTNTDSYDESTESDKDSDSDEEKQEKSPDSTNRAAIKMIENRIAALSEEDPKKNEQVIREFESVLGSLLTLEKEEEEEYVDTYKIPVVNVIMNLLTYYDEHKSAFTPDLLHKLNDVVNPMLLLSAKDLDLIRNSVKKFYDCSDDHRIAIEDFCGMAMDWLGYHDHDDDEYDSRTVLRDYFPKIISAVKEKLKNPEPNPEEQLLLAKACAETCAYLISHYNYPETFLDSDNDEEYDATMMKNMMENLSLNAMTPILKE